MAIDVILTIAVLLLALGTQQMAALQLDAPAADAQPSQTASTKVSEASEYISMDTEGITPELKVTAPIEFAEWNQTTTSAPTGIMTSHSETVYTTTITPDVSNGKGRPVELSGVCQAWSESDIDLVCSLPRAQVTIKGQAGSHVIISCQSGTELSCEHLPQLQLMPTGLNSSIRVELHECAPPPRIACLGERFAAPIAHLYLFQPPGDARDVSPQDHKDAQAMSPGDAQAMSPGDARDVSPGNARDVRITPHMLDGLEQLERFAVFGDGVDTYSMDFPREAFASRPLLRSLTINNIKLSLNASVLDGVTGLEYLELSKVGLTSLPPAIFAKLNKLQKLNIWKNQIDDIHDDTFQGLSSLQQLDISSNTLRSVTTIADGLPPAPPARAASLPATHAAPPLTALAANANRIQLLTPLARLEHLQKLELFGNKVPLSIAAGALASLPHLSDVNLQRNSIKRLPADMFHNSSALKRLRLGNNDISELPADLFRDLKALEELDLSRNKLTELRPLGFLALSSLNKLDLSYNRITTLSSSVFLGACALSWLSASHNAVRAVVGGALSCGGRGRLEFIDLSHNHLISFTSEHAHTQYENLNSPFGPHADTLQVLDLSHNQLEAAPYDITRFIGLRRLDLSHNNLTELSPQDLSFLSAQAEVDYRHNLIATVRLTHAAPAGPPATVHHAPLSPRSTAMLDFNPFDCDCKLYDFATRLHGYAAYDTTESRVEVGGASCSKPPVLRARPLVDVALREFACFSYDIPSLPCAAGCTCAYRPHTAALELVCSAVPPRPDTTDIPELHMELTLTEANFSTFTFDVRVLNLSGLSLTAVPDMLPHGLHTLDLSNNQLTEIPEHLLELDIKLRLAGNALRCDCSHRGALRLLKHFWYNIEDGADVRCSDGLPFTDVSVDALCSTRTAILIGVPLALIGLLTATLAVIFMRYSLEIRVWLHAKGWFIHWEAIDDEQRSYDAFVSFCHKDEAFVTDHLVPGLEKGSEGSGSYKLCVHYRDWIPGEWIPAQIARSVADSRRTIIVVSKHFLDSLWGRAEFRTANMSAIKERQTRVIVILLEDISSHKELDPELKAYLSANTYLKWGDPWFWEKLRYALPHRRQPDKPEGKGKVKGSTHTQASTGTQGLKGVTGLPDTLSPAGLLVPAALPTAFANKCEKFDIEIGSLKGMDFADLKQIQTIT